MIKISVHGLTFKNLNLIIYDKDKCLVTYEK
jgi:hypothetical protein